MNPSSAVPKDYDVRELYRYIEALRCLGHASNSLLDDLQIKISAVSKLTLAS